MDGPASCQELPSPRRNLQDSATCHPRFLGSSARVLRPKPAKPATGSFGLNYRTPSFAAQTRKPLRMVLRPKPPNHSTRATLSSPGRTPSPLSLRSTRASTVLTRSTRSTSMSSRTHRCQVRATTASPPAPMVPQSEPRFRPSPLSVHRHGKPLLDLLHAIDHCH